MGMNFIILPFEYKKEEYRYLGICHGGISTSDYLQLLDIHYPNRTTTIYDEINGYDCNPRPIDLGRDITKEFIDNLINNIKRVNDTCARNFKYEVGIQQQLEYDKNLTINSPESVSWEEDYHI
jgi:hypothetical protein